MRRRVEGSGVSVGVKKAGNEKASRAVGNILHKNQNPEIPCHRVIRSDGKLGGYNKGEREKMKILKEELKLAGNLKHIKISTK